MDVPYWTGFFNGALAATGLSFAYGAWWLRRERATFEDLQRRIDALNTEVTRREMADCAPAVPLTGIVQKELPPNRVSETWAEDQRRWHEFLGRVDPDRSRP